MHFENFKMIGNFHKKIHDDPICHRIWHVQKLLSDDPVPQELFWYECMVLGNTVRQTPSVEACMIRNVNANRWVENGVYKD